MDDGDGRPVLTGLLALVGVALAVGLVLGLVAVAGARIVGIGGAVDAQSTPEHSMYLPSPSKTAAPSGPLITLAPGETQAPSSSSSSASAAPSEKPSRTRKSKPEISLSAGATSVAPMQQIDLTGVYPGGEGAILQVQRFTNGAWQDFPVTVSVSNQTFSTYVQTSQTGQNRFRVVDTDSGRASNPVRVQIG
ncbi:hypothetical protein [Nocardioides panaciterrulae]|uniref:Uncharacterized protein n=1 Tax=Nocardioides panaciterrulae TaxID=661492 RepID=A0A7Y9JAF9_9ACTN|nr:hypothetical protein [Nocardioides panaciterrulae]NYD40299.1 hypothetical protein [Nocardioides panaciterrulae]